MPRVSIIIPFNNGKRYLDKCLKSLSNIEFNDYEIILIDDFSKDNSEQIAKKYERTKYHYTNEETIGVGNARNLGIEKASGDYACRYSRSAFLPYSVSPRIGQFSPS